MPFALVEVFSSEGCSSCPPAERAVDALAASRPGVIALSFHVDYWDYLGWRDPYSSTAATARQQSYVAAWGTRSTYTPMVVVQGEEHHGGTGGALTAAVERALATVPKVRMTVTVHAATAASPIVVDYVTEAAPDGSTVLVAAVESGLVQRVMRGENAGETLHHEHVVRAWRVAPAGRGSTELTLPAGARADAVATVVFEGTKPIAGLLSPNRSSPVAR